MSSWPNYKSLLTFDLSYIKKGSGPGSDPNDSYDFNNPYLDVDTHMLMGNINTSLIFGLKINYKLTTIISVTSYINYNLNEKVFSGRLGLLMNYQRTTVQVVCLLPNIQSNIASAEAIITLMIYRTPEWKIPDR